MHACRTCRLIITTKDKNCPKCGGEVSDKYSGMIIILDSTKSDVAKLVSVNANGSYAIKVK